VEWIDLAQDMDQVLCYLERDKDPSGFLNAGIFCTNSVIFIIFSTRTVFCGMNNVLLVNIIDVIKLNQ
jgi:hypothetical protein